MGTVTATYVAHSAAKPMEEVSTAQVEAGLGIVGDRYHAASGTWTRAGKEHNPSRHITVPADASA